jgi:hypothetical protein
MMRVLRSNEYIGGRRSGEVEDTMEIMGDNVRVGRGDREVVPWSVLELKLVERSGYPVKINKKS